MKHRIRTKLGLSLLVVMLIPLVPSYYLVKGLVNRSFELGFNQTIETAIEGAKRISSKLYGHYREETLEICRELAESKAVVGLLRGEAEFQEAALDEAAGALDACVIDVYDARNRLVASHARLREEADAAEPVREEAESEEINIGAQIAEQAFNLLNITGDEIPIDTLRTRIDELSQKEEAEILEGSNDPGYISVFVPIVEGDERLGSMVVVRIMDEEFAQGARHIMAVNRIFRTLDYYKDDIRTGFLAFFSLFCALMAVLAMAVGYVFARRLTAPLLRLVQGTQTVAAGDLDYRIEVSSRDEIGQLMESFNKMIAAIKENQRLIRQQEQKRQQVEEENRRRAKDLEMSELRARALQAENERQTVELQKSQELERAYQELEESHRQLQEAQAQLILQENMASLGAMVAGVAHEINNPMGAVRSAADVTRRCIGRVERAVADSASLETLRDGSDFQRTMGILKENVQVIRQAEERITTLVDSLKNFARLDEAEFQMADLHAGLDTTLNLLHQQLGTGVEVTKEYGEIPRTYCSPGQLNQVFMNVIKNAAQAIESEGKIAISTSQQNGDICVRVCDTGVGIPSEKLERIFDLRFSAKSSRVRMGSGLSMAYRIVQEHGGRIGIDSESGQGTEVTIRLPVRAGKGEEKQEG